MAKIRKYTFNASDDSTQQEYSVDIYYSTKEGWFCNVHDEFKESFYQRLEDLKELGARLVYASNRDRVMGNNAKPVIKGDNEGDVCHKVKKVYNILLSTTVIKRKVIVVFFEGERSTMFNNHRSDNKFPQVQMQFGLNFCTEIKASPTAPPKYYTYHTWKSFNGEDHIDKKELHIWKAQAAIVDDTDENRTFLIGLYKSYVALRDQLVKFTSTSDKLLELIQSNTLLLPNSTDNGKDQIQES